MNARRKIADFMEDITNLSGASRSLWLTGLYGESELALNVIPAFRVAKNFQWDPLLDIDIGIVLLR